MELVLPLIERDLPRFELLQRSLSAFMRGMGAMHVVVPDSEVEPIRRAILSMDPGFEWKVVAESGVVPEFEHFPAMRGWQRQQLIKLAMAEHIESDFFMVLDADLVCTRPISPDRLLRDGKAPCRVRNEQSHPQWYVHAGEVLRMEVTRKGVSHNVTPAILSRTGVLELARHLQRCWRFPPMPRRGRARSQAKAWLRHRLGRTPGSADWRLYLLASTPWTEYSLYFTFLEAAGRFQEFHYQCENGLYDGDRSVWKAEQIADGEWDPAPCFAGEGPPYFIVIQSNTGVPVGSYAPALTRWLGGSTAGYQPASLGH